MKETQTRTRFSLLKERISSYRQTFFNFIDRRPMTSFFGLIGILLLIIILGNLLRKPADALPEAETSLKEVEIFSIAQAPKISFSGNVEKSGVINIVAQSSGIVQYINVTPGQRVWKGQVLLGLSTNYQGGTLQSVSRQIAQQNYTVTEENYPAQQELINKRREVAEKTDAMNDQLREITAQSFDATRTQISLNEQIIFSLDEQISELEMNNAEGTNSALITQVKSSKSGVLSGLSALKSALRSGEYQASSDDEGAQLSNLSKDLTIKQLEVEERSLALGKEIARLNLTIAQISESLMYPASPETGIIERIHVYPGQSVNPGTVLATITADKNVAHVVVTVSSDIAKQLSRLEKSNLIVGGQTIELSPRYISTEPTDGTLHTVLFTLSEEQSEWVTQGMSIQVQMPIGQVKATASVPYVPIDAIFQTQDTALLYVASNSGERVYTVVPKEVELGTVFGSYVQIRSGISQEDQVILNRDVLSGDTVSFK